MTAQHDPTRCCDTCAWALEFDSLDGLTGGRAVACGWTGPTPPFPEWLTDSNGDGPVVTADGQIAAWAIQPRTAGTTCPAWESLLQVDLELADQPADFEPDAEFLTLITSNDTDE